MQVSTRWYAAKETLAVVEDAYRYAYAYSHECRHIGADKDMEVDTDISTDIDVDTDLSVNLNIENVEMDYIEFFSRQQEFLELGLC